MNKRLKKLLSILLIVSFIGACPGISDNLILWAQEAPIESTAEPGIASGTHNSQDASGSLSAANPFAVESSTDTPPATVTVTDEQAEAQKKEAEKKKEMGRVEKLAWTIGKALLPTLAVMAFGAAVVCPLAWVVVGSVVIGAATAGIVTFAHESRLNQFREEGKKKSRDRILRDVSIAAAVEGAMAPFSMVSAGFIKAIGPATVRSVATAAAKAGAVQFVGGTISNVTKGAVTNLWYDKYYNYDDEEKELRAELERINSKPDASEEDKIRAVEIMQRLDYLEKEKYTMSDFWKDERKTAVTAAISGVLGGAATSVAANQKWAKVASDKLFKSPKNSAMVARAVVTNPFAFVSGSANAGLQKREIDFEIARCREKQDSYPPGSPAYGYYEDKIAGLEKAKDSIDLIKSGNEAMINNLAVQSAGLTVAVGKARLWDLPKARRDAIAQKIKETSPEWQNAESIKAKSDTLRANPPKRENFSSREAYFAARREHKQKIANLDTEYKAAKVIAVESQNTIEGEALKAQVTQEIDAQLDLKRRTDLAKSLGDEEYLKFKMDEIRKRATAENQELTDAEVREQAVKEFKQEYLKAAESDAAKLAKMEEKLTLRKDIKDLKGKVVTDENGKKFVVLEDADGVEKFRRAMNEPKQTWLNKFFQKDPGERELKEIEAAYRIANASGAMTKPSEYRSAYVDMKVNELKAQGLTETQIAANMSGIVREADGAMLNTFGGSWSSAAQAEMLAAGLTRAKYQNGEPPNFEAIYNAFQSTAQSKIIAEFQKELTNQAKAYTLTPIKNQVTGGKNDSFFQKFVNNTLDKVFAESVGTVANKQVKSAYESIEKSASTVVKEVKTEATWDYEKNANPAPATSAP